MKYVTRQAGSDYYLLKKEDGNTMSNKRETNDKNKRKNKKQAKRTQLLKEQSENKRDKLYRVKIKQ